jgi:hypothetical protein
MSITPSAAACRAPSCPVDLGPSCPPALQGPFDSTGFAVGCKSACFVDPNPRELLIYEQASNCADTRPSHRELARVLLGPVQHRRDVPAVGRALLRLL